VCATSRRRRPTLETLFSEGARVVAVATRSARLPVRSPLGPTNKGTGAEGS
jgi:hypothetical protein